MVRPVTHFAATRRRGNPDWRRPVPPTTVCATEFEMQVRQLQLTEQMYASSRELRIWGEQNRNRHYIPEWLLKEWCIVVEPDKSGVA